MSLIAFVADILMGTEPDGIAARQREIDHRLAVEPCVHGIEGAWSAPAICRDCQAVIEASRIAAELRTVEARKAAEARLRAALEARFVTEVREELGRLRSGR